MRKLQPYRKIRLENLRRRNELKRKIINKQNKNSEVKFNKAVNRITLYKDRKSRVVKSKLTAVSPPRDLNLTENWDETVQFLNDLRNSVDTAIERFANLPKSQLRIRNRKQRRSLIVDQGRYFDFTKIDNISPQVALIIASEFDRQCDMSGVKPSAINIERWKPKVRDLLNAIGFLELSGVNDSEADYTDIGNLRILRLKSGSVIDGRLISEYLLNLGYNIFEEHPAIYDAIVEAIGNAVYHGYRDESNLSEKHVKKWWIFGTRLSGENWKKIRISVYDQGVTIPKTLPKWKLFPDIADAINRMGRMFGFQNGVDIIRNSSFDGSAIEAAIEVGKTSTMLAHRGHGMSQIVSVLGLCKSGYVAIYSRAGFVRYETGRKPVVRNCAVPLTGTLVVWDIELEVPTK